jgi:hypothetical protein
MFDCRIDFPRPAIFPDTLLQPSFLDDLPVCFPGKKMM